MILHEDINKRKKPGENKRRGGGGGGGGERGSEVEIKKLSRAYR